VNRLVLPASWRDSHHDHGEDAEHLIESAWFDPAAIRKGSRRHGLHTDASHRFERGPPIRISRLLRVTGWRKLI